MLCSWGQLQGKNRRVRCVKSVGLTGPTGPLFPGLALTFTVLGYNMVGDSLRDMFDPRMVMKGKRR